MRHVLLVAALVGSACRRTPELRAKPDSVKETGLSLAQVPDDEIDTSAIDGPAPLPKIPRIAAGPNHTCVLDVNGRASCFGRNESGALGDGSLTDHPLDLVAVKLDGIAQLGVGNEFSCALRQDRTVWCWGTGTRFLFPSNAHRPSPEKIAGLPRIRSIGVRTRGRTTRGRHGAGGRARARSA
jgi:hypothetical protein